MRAAHIRAARAARRFRKTNIKMKDWRGWSSTWGCNEYSLALFRISLGSLLLAELILRYRFLHPFYSDEGTFPIKFLQHNIDTIYRIVCLHCHSGTMSYQIFLLTIQVVCAASFTLGYKTKISSILCWFLYLSLTLRNTWLAFILDRYFHFLLFYSIFLPLSNVWSLDAFLTTNKITTHTTVLSLPTMALKLQILWIYIDAGSGKYMDPLGGWTWNAHPLPALDTYARHTIGARYLYALLGPNGLRFLTPTVVYVELLCAPLALLASFFGQSTIVNVIVFLVCMLHIGISITMRNTVLLSLVACSAWSVYLPPSRFFHNKTATDHNNKTLNNSSSNNNNNSSKWSTLLIPCFVLGSVWFETLSGQCDQSMEHIWSILLHNRWNVFVGAEEYVTWEIAPGRLLDGTVVDVWSKTNTLHWSMPGNGAPSTSTHRPGRWRSFPYLADFASQDGTEESNALWGYLCREWDDTHGVVVSPGHSNNWGKKLLRYNFFMLQADVLPNMSFSPTRKRLIHSHDCTATTAGNNDTNEAHIDKILPRKMPVGQQQQKQHNHHEQQDL